MKEEGWRMGKGPVVIVGGFVEAVELCEMCGYEIVGIVDKDPFFEGSYKLLGTEDNIDDIFCEYRSVPVLIAVDQPVVRDMLAKQYREKGFRFCSVVSPLANISKSANLGVGCFVQSFVNVSSRTRIGDYSRLNSGANIMHDCDVGECCTIAPNAVLLGGVRVGSLAYVGANSTILPGKVIGEKSIVGAGAVVSRNVSNGSTVKGVPAR